MLGQEQDKRGSLFAASESYVGTITRLNIWDSVLAEEEIVKLAGPCGEEMGTVRAWPDFLSGIHGLVKKVDSTYCTGETRTTSVEETGQALLYPPPVKKFNLFNQSALSHSSLTKLRPRAGI